MAIGPREKKNRYVGSSRGLEVGIFAERSAAVKEVTVS